MRVILAFALVALAAPRPAFAGENPASPYGSDEAGAIAGGRVKAWEPALQRITIALSKKVEVVLETQGAIIQGAPAVGRVVDVTYTGSRAQLITVRP